MHHETDALVRQGRHRRLSVGWFTSLALAGLPLVGAASCTAGELNDRQEKYLRKELAKDYPATETPADTTSEQNPDPTTEAPAETSSEPAATSSDTTTQATAEQSSDVVTSEASSSATSSEGSTSSEAPTNTIPDCVMEIFHTTCSGSVCHYQGAVNLPPNFETTDDIFTMLTTTSAASCDDAVSKVYIDLANPQNSYLLAKVKAQQPSGCGNPMPPPSEPAITQNELTCLEGWIGSL